MDEPAQQVSGEESGVPAPNPSVKTQFTKENAATMGRKGGSRSTTRKLIALSLVARKHCRTDCPLYPCPFTALSHAADQGYGGKCALKQSPLKMQERILNLFLKGKDGAMKELTNTLADIALKAADDKSLVARALYFDKVCKYIETTYGKKITQENSGEITGTLTVKFKEPAWTKDEKTTPTQ